MQLEPDIVGQHAQSSVVVILSELFRDLGEVGFFVLFVFGWVCVCLYGKRLTKEDAQRQLACEWMGFSCSESTFLSS
jgi:hypothetical protein